MSHRISPCRICILAHRQSDKTHHPASPSGYAGFYIALVLLVVRPLHTESIQRSRGNGARYRNASNAPRRPRTTYMKPCEMPWALSFCVFLWVGWYLRYALGTFFPPARRARMASTE
jgi:hypothetical protein